MQDIDTRLGNKEHVYIKRLTRALHVGYCRAQKILKEYVHLKTRREERGREREGGRGREGAREGGRKDSLHMLTCLIGI